MLVPEVAFVGDESRPERLLRGLLVLFFGSATVLFVLAAPITGFFSLPLALVTGGLAHGVAERGSGNTTPAGAGWLIGVGLILFAGEIAFLLVFAGDG